MNYRIFDLALLAFGSVVLASPAAAQRSIRRLEAPAPDNSGECRLQRGADGEVYLSWIETLDDGKHALSYSILDGDIWNGPWEVARGENWFVNWADVPGVTALEDGTLLAWWLVNDEKDSPHAYHVHYAISKGWGERFGEASVLHKDKSAVEHGFVSAAGLDAEHFGVLWLDGRKTTKKNGATSLMFRRVSKSGELDKEVVVDDRVCDCCPVSLVSLGAGDAVAAYRDRTKDDFRDTSIARMTKGKWRLNYTHGPDRWQVDACPVNGPHLANLGPRVMMARYTEGDSIPDVPKRVVVALSEDGGASFDDVVQLDGDVYGRVSGAFFEDGRFAVTWMEKKRSGGQWKVLEFRADGQALAPQPMARVPTSRRSGRATLARTKEGHLVAAWPEVLAGKRRISSALYGER